jgi:hypothetical protein
MLKLPIVQQTLQFHISSIIHCNVASLHVCGVSHLRKKLHVCGVTCQPLEEKVCALFQKIEMSYLYGNTQHHLINIICLAKL